MQGKTISTTSWDKGMHWQIQDFPQGGGPIPKIAIIYQIFGKNCMKMKELRPPGGVCPWSPPWIRQWHGYP